MQVKAVIMSLMWLATSGGTGAWASPTLDQSNPLSAGIELSNRAVWQQQVTDEIGGLLSSITLYSAVPGAVDMGVTVQVGVGSTIDPGPFAFTGTENLTNAGTSIDTSAAGIDLTPGETFVIQISGGSTFSGASSTLYAGGDLWDLTSGFNFTNFGTDMAFETFMDPSTTTTGVPEPLSLSLFGAGLAGAVATRRRKAGA